MFIVNYYLLLNYYSESFSHMKKFILLFISSVILQSLFATSSYSMVIMNIFEAAKIGDTDIIRELIASHENVNQQDDNGRTPLHWSALNGHLAVVQTLIMANANVNQQDKYGWTPLHWSALNGHLAVSKILIKCGANVNQKDNDGLTALDWAVKRDHPDIVDVINRVNAAPAVAKNQILALACAGHPRLGVALPSLQSIFHGNSEVARIAAPFIRQAAFEDALCGHNQS